MDHLKAPASVIQRIQVRYLEGEPYDGRGFFEYPLRRGFAGNSTLAYAPSDIMERVSCKGAIDHLEKIWQCILPAVKERNGAIHGLVELLQLTFRYMCTDAKDVRNIYLPGLMSVLAESKDPHRLGADATQAIRWRGWCASWFSACGAGKPPERYSIGDAQSFYINALIRMYEGEADPEIGPCRDMFNTFHNAIKTLRKIAMLVPDDVDLGGMQEYYSGYMRSVEDFTWKRTSPSLPWFYTDADKARMVVFCLEGDFDVISGDRDYNGGDPFEYLNWTTDFKIFDTKQRQDRQIARKTIASLAELSSNASGERRQLKSTYRYFLHGERSWYRPEPPSVTPEGKPVEERKYEDSLHAPFGKISQNLGDTNVHASAVQSELPVSLATQDDTLPEFPSKFLERWSEASREDISAQLEDCRKTFSFMCDNIPVPNPELKQSKTISEEQYFAFLQTWLFFGTLTEVFAIAGIYIVQSDFICEVDGARFITTSRLDFYLRQWVSNEREVLPESLRAKRARDIDLVLSCAVSYCRTFDGKQFISTPMDFCLAASVMCLTLKTVWYTVYHPTTLNFLSTDETYQLQSKFLRDKFLEAGWCVNKVDSICDVWPLTLQYYAYQLGPPRTTKNHELCFRQSCKVNHIDYRTYKTKHLNDPHCPCRLILGWICHVVQSQEISKKIREAENYSAEFFQRVLIERPIATVRTSPTMFEDGHWEVPTEKVESIVREGGIPLITMLGPSVDPYDVAPDVIKYELGTMYSAISHVWADGLGNPRRNSLPLCQLLGLRARLFKLIEKYWKKSRAPSMVAFWIDTLCVPLGPTIVRRKAIMNMQDVYRQAFVTLVLDSGLMQNSYPLDSLETLVRVQTSDWSSRLWTFQEAALAPRLHFQFLDACSEEVCSLMLSGSLKSIPPTIYYGITHAALQVQWYPSFSIWNRVESHFTDMSKERVLPVLSKSRLNHRWRRFYIVWKGLQRRSTSRVIDQIVCVAILLDLDMAPILQIEEERGWDRLKELFKIIKVFPAGILFVITSRMDDDGYGWAPESMLCNTTQLDRILSAETPATLSASGLCVSFPGIVFPDNTIEIQPTHSARYCSMVSDRVYLEVIQKGQVETGDIASKLYYVFEIELPGHSHDNWKIHDPSSFAIIFQHAIMPQAKKNFQQSTPAALVSILANENGVIHAVFKCTLIAKFSSKPDPRSTEQTDNAHLIPSVYKSKIRNLADGEYTSFDQQWVIH